jgi:hypothetical protein
MKTIIFSINLCNCWIGTNFAFVGLDIQLKYTRMQIIGKLIQLLPVQTGTGKNGEWKKQDILIETESQYPKKVCISIWGVKINLASLELGKTLTIEFDAESREFSGRWYTELKAWKIEVNGQGANSPNKLATAEPLELPEDEDGNLPF